jgi:tetratricopeptide (TPR) repeat protein
MYYIQVLGSSGSQGDLEALMGKAKYFQANQSYANALQCLNQVIVVFPWFLPGLTEKCKIQMQLGEWEQAADTAKRVLDQDAQVCSTPVTRHSFTRQHTPALCSERRGG